MMTLAPTPADRIAMMRERFEVIMAAIGDAQGQLSARPHLPSHAERDVQATLGKLERMAEQLAGELPRDTDAAEATLGAMIATIQGELRLRLRVLAGIEQDATATARAAAWSAWVESIAEGESVAA